MRLVEQPELRARFRAGERSALAEVYHHYAPEVAKVLMHGFSFQSRGQQLRFAGFAQPFDLDNALQETFSRAFKESARLGYDGLHAYAGYLVGIARNFVIDELRRREVAMSPLVEILAEGGDASDGISDPAPAAASAEQELLRRELGRLYQVFVAALDDRERGFFRARFEARGTQVEAGAAVGLSHMQARTLEKKLRQRFLEFMHAHGYLDGYGGGVKLSMLPLLWIP